MSDVKTTPSNGGKAVCDFDAILKTTQKEPLKSLLPDELFYIVSAFLPSEPAAQRSKAYLILSAFCQGVRHSYADASCKSRSKQDSDSNPAVHKLVQVFAPEILNRLRETNESDVVAGISFHDALFQVDWEVASAIFLEDGVYDLIMDAVELSPPPAQTLAVAHLLGQAAGHKACRSILTSACGEWLETQFRRSSDTDLRAAAAVAVIKLSRGTANDEADIAGTSAGMGKKMEDLAAAMKTMVLNPSNSRTQFADEIEGLAYLSASPAVKEMLSNDHAFLKRLFGLVPRRKKGGPGTVTVEADTTLLFGIVVVISNMAAYRPRMTEEQVHIEKLRSMAKAGKKEPPVDEAAVLGDDEHVKARNQRLVAAGVLEVFPNALTASDTPGMRLHIGKSLLHIVEDPANRGRTLQSGCAKTLLTIIHAYMSASSQSISSSPQKTFAVDAAALEPIQALAKLAITASPIQVFGPDEGAMHDAVRPLSALLQHDASSLLQRFEALMALTNLASHGMSNATARGPTLAERIASTEGLLNHVELLLLGEHTLVRRASMELICNLVAGSEFAFERYGGGDSPASGEGNRNAKSKLQLLIALADVEDLPTRLAASGALAALTSSPRTRTYVVELQMERHRVMRILTELIDPHAVTPRVRETDPGLVHRGIVCAHNVLLGIDDPDVMETMAREAREAGLDKALMDVARDSMNATGGNASRAVNEAALRPLAETLEFLMGTR
ncbi:hypothetical protein FISHEDRAFT_39048 [Fistulina hepatica ATCC 64428]|uniref:UNC-45/Cro1/She4 central domain-containing protein n=1 Tax=Fistulina hepatica ATCC 64428 TaxID=1128425 RepID=A0A0D7AG61_9AGAR|nr:hypothetical protein FISHEDRAFT_39048 [Fistulina hepatica ATCC 64428]